MQISTDQLLSFLSSHFSTEIRFVEPAGFGEWSQAFFFRAEERDLVVRFSRYNEDFQKDRFAARFSSPRLPIPPIEESGQAFDLYYAISPRVAGKLIDHFDSSELRAALPALMELFIALHDVDGSETHGYGGFGADGHGSLASWRDFLTAMSGDSPSSRLHGWKEKLARVPGAAELYTLGRRRLLDLLPYCPEERHLVHNDLLHYNLILQGSQVAAVIDWGCGLWGDYLYDLAMLLAWQFYYPAMAGIDFSGEAWRAFSARGIALPHFHERLQCYQIHLLLDSLAYNAWQEDRTNLELTRQRLGEILKG